MRDEILLSIVIVNYNTSRYLRQCLNSIYRSQGNLGKLEVIVVDNASSDRSYLELKKSFPELIIIQNKTNLGFAKANNLGIKQTTGQFVLLLNPDTVVEKNTLFTSLQYFLNNKEAGILTCMVYLPDGTIDDACHRGFPTPWGALCYFSGLSRLFPKSIFFNSYHLGYNCLDQIHEIDSCSGAFMMIRRPIGERLNWLDTDYFWYGEDLDFCYRAKQINSKIIFLPGISIMHYKGISSGIKKHSKEISTADKDITRRALNARFEVMEIFYRKHYLHRYPKLIYYFVLYGIKFLKLFIFFFTD